MRTDEMSRVLTEVKITNLEDAWAARKGSLTPDRVRSKTVSDALVDTGATSVALPTSLIRELGLTKRYDKQARTAVGLRSIGVYDAVRVEIMGRDCTVDPIEVPDETGVLVGQIPLEMMDFVVDPQGRKLIGNPAHNGQQVIELL
jgi:predicted aspartyl protease